MIVGPTVHSLTVELHIAVQQPKTREQLMQQDQYVVLITVYAVLLTAVLRWSAKAPTLTSSGGNASHTEVG